MKLIYLFINEAVSFLNKTFLSFHLYLKSISLSVIAMRLPF